jgi:hypothetical protein
MRNKMLSAAAMFEAACLKHGIRLDVLVAETAIWAHPETHGRQLRSSGSAAVYPGVRRAKSGQGEKRGVKNGVGLDDNTYANNAIKAALGMHRTQIVGFECCHIWSGTCYDDRYHTAIANLVLIPRALASLTDHDASIQAALKYRAFELYDWHPDDQSPPSKPLNYPENWLEPQPDPLWRPAAPPVIGGQSNDDPVSLEKLRGWASSPRLKVHSIIAIACARGSLSRNQLVNEIEKYGIASDPYGSVASLMTNGGNAYGRVFVEENGRLYFHPRLKEEILRHAWKLPPMSAAVDR